MGPSSQPDVDAAAVAHFRLRLGLLVEAGKLGERRGTRRKHDKMCLVFAKGDSFHTVLGEGVSYNKRKS